MIATPTRRQFEMPFGARLLPDGGVAFRLWAPTAQQVSLELLGQTPRPMTAEQEPGWFSLTVPEADADSEYQFVIGPEQIRVPDPASRYQPRDVHGPSRVTDPNRFEWQDQDWRGRPWEQTVLYELHVGTFSPEGTYLGVIPKLGYLAELGITAIELMPVADFPGSRNWGYDGVLPFAPESSYGTPDELKALVQAAHQHGLMVFMDVVYNHFGPEGNYLHAYAQSFFNSRYHTPWGDAINYDAEQSRWVREFVVSNCLYWLEEFHLDGLRFDAIHAIYDQSQPHIVTEIVERVRRHFPPERHVHLVLENDDNGAHFLAGHSQHRAQATAQWNDDAHHALHVLLTDEDSGYYQDYTPADAPASQRSPIEHLGRVLASGFSYQGEASRYRHGEPRGEQCTHLPLTSFVNFLQNHDQIGNRAFGNRLAELSSQHGLRAAVAALLLSPSIPLIFMGEEWASQTPFQFFCDFCSDLAPLVTQGRRQEFARFAEFSDPLRQAKIPDPSAEATFLRSKLNWSELQSDASQSWLNYYRDLLRLRQTEIVPRLTTLPPDNNRFEVLGPKALRVTWYWPDEATLVLLSNFDKKPVKVALPCMFNLFESRRGAYQLVCGKSELPPESTVWMVYRRLTDAS
jgi:1,4-alpha-glucan branching enzyme/maltooligosyltrehalose trehalohydrolase